MYRWSYLIIAEKWLYDNYCVRQKHSYRRNMYFTPQVFRHSVARRFIINKNRKQKCRSENIKKNIWEKNEVLTYYKKKMREKKHVPRRRDVFLSRSVQAFFISYFFFHIKCIVWLIIGRKKRSYKPRRYRSNFVSDCPRKRCYKIAIILFIRLFLNRPTTVQNSNKSYSHTKCLQCSG